MANRKYSINRVIVAFNREKYCENLRINNEIKVVYIKSQLSSHDKVNMTQGMAFIQFQLTIPISVKQMTTAKQRNAMYAAPLMYGCLDCRTFTVSNPPMTNINAVSV